MNVWMDFLLPLLGAALLTALSVRILLPLLLRQKVGQTILEIGPAWHKSKEGTPTMGGIVFLPILLFCGSIFLIFRFQTLDTQDRTAFLFTLLFILLSGAVGIFDDLTKLQKKQNAGLSPGQKIILQTLITVFYLFLMHFFGGLGTVVTLPFLGKTLEISYLYDFLVVFLALGIVNCANLTDGIDGLLSSVSAILGLFFSFLSFLATNDGAATISALMTGISVGFLFYNAHPARIFMGDTGSLFLGATTVGCAILLEQPLLLCFMPAVFIWEGITDILQVFFYKCTGKRIFRMAPFHHHLEAGGYSENRIVLLFSGITVIFGILAVLSVL